MELAPIVLFVYNRPWHTEQMLEALMRNELADKSILSIYADGSKEKSNSEELKKIEAVRKVIRKKQWCGEVRIIESEKNNGLVNSVIKGVTEIVNEFGKIIVLEDDLITSKGFLKYMNASLNIFYNRQNVFSVTGHMFNINYKNNHVVLLPYISTWGWGTWKNRWNEFDFNMSKVDVLLKNHSLQTRFNLSDYNYISMLKKTKSSWGIRWYYSVFIRNGLSVFPTKSLINNIGFDGSGTNCEVLVIDNTQLQESIDVKYTEIIDLNFWHLYLDYFTSNRNNLLSKIKMYVKKILNKLFNILVLVRAKSKLFINTSYGSVGGNSDIKN